MKKKELMEMVVELQSKIIKSQCDGNTRQLAKAAQMYMELRADMEILETLNAEYIKQIQDLTNN